jgi:protein transport protein SEC13
VLIWKEQQQGQGGATGSGGWTKVKEHTLHTASGASFAELSILSPDDRAVNSVSWAPHELGAILACASSDGKLSVLTFKSTFSVIVISGDALPLDCPIHFSESQDDGQWGADIFNGHAIGCNAVSWAPATALGSLIAPQQSASIPGQAPAPPQSVKRFASAGCDNLVKIWGYREDSQSWVEEETLEGHTDWVRDVAWAPNIGLPRSYIATASQVLDGAFYLSLCGS